MIRTERIRRIICGVMGIFFVGFGLVANEVAADPGNKDVSDGRGQKTAEGYNIPGCVDVDTTVFYTWACPKHPAARPDLCYAEKRRLEDEGICKSNLIIKTDDLLATGKTHPHVYHRKYTGYKLSGPFTQLKDAKDGRWWVQTYHWNIAQDDFNQIK